jgi:CubicO group peptidase (beta-lactamase class C family)
MKAIVKTLITLVVLVSLTSCSSIRVATDYDSQVDFKEYKTFAFYKPGIDQAELSDLDKRRILKAIENELTAKGFTKSTEPDMLISIFTKSNQRVDVFNNNWGAWGWGPGWGWGWGPGWGAWGPGWGWGGGWGGNNVSVNTEGTLFIDLIDYNKKELIWQGSGKGDLPQNKSKKEEKIKQFVNEVMLDFPPQPEEKKNS